MFMRVNNKNVVRGFSLVQVPFVTLSDSEGSKRTRRFFAALRMTKQESNNG